MRYVYEGEFPITCGECGEGKRQTPNGNTPAKFWARVDRSHGPEACWVWTGVRSSSGYGRTSLNGKQIPAHRLAVLFVRGEVADGRDLMHSCDNPVCCNPAHLSWGTRAENMHDAVRKAVAS